MVAMAEQTNTHAYKHTRMQTHTHTHTHTRTHTHRVTAVAPAVVTLDDVVFQILLSARAINVVDKLIAVTPQLRMLGHTLPNSNDYSVTGEQFRVIGTHISCRKIHLYAHKAEDD
jgi:hypothetical protein